MAHSREYRERAVAYKDEGHTFAELEEAFKIPHQTYYLWKERMENGYYDKKIKQERKRKIDKELLKKTVEENPDMYQYELAELFGCTAVAICLALKKMGITRKKTVYL